MNPWRNYRNFKSCKNCKTQVRPMSELHEQPIISSYIPQVYGITMKCIMWKNFVNEITSILLLLNSVYIRIYQFKNSVVLRSSCIIRIVRKTNIGILLAQYLAFSRPHGRSKFLRNVGIYVPVHTALIPSRLTSTFLSHLHLQFPM
jgi:hypothetical protein